MKRQYIVKIRLEAESLAESRDKVAAIGGEIVSVEVIHTALSSDDWPLWAKALKMMAQPNDKGIGDVLYRTIGPENSEAFKKWFKATTGKDCGCAGRQARWNAMYPLK